jgi:hypothetical protein
MSKLLEFRERERDDFRKFFFISLIKFEFIYFYQLSVSKTIAGFLLLHNLDANEVNSEIGPPRNESVFPLASI